VSAARKLKKPTAYQVGYAKPPVHSRFQPGRSGNPRGRPKGARNRPTLPGPREEKLKHLILEEAYRPVTVKDGDNQVTIPMAQAVLRSVAVNAAKGSHRAQRHFADLVSGTERNRKRESDEFLQAAIEYKCGWEAELERRERLGIAAPDPIPHPDDVVVTLHDGTVRFKGPVTKEDKTLLDRSRRAIESSRGRTRLPSRRTQKASWEAAAHRGHRIRGVSPGTPNECRADPHRRRSQADPPALAAAIAGKADGEA